MRNEMIEELVKAQAEQTVTLKALALADGLRAMNPLRTRLPTEGRVVLAEEVFALHIPEGAHPDNLSWPQAGKSSLNATLQLAVMDAAQECAIRAYIESMNHGNCGTYLSPLNQAQFRLVATGAGQTTLNGSLFKKLPTKKRKTGYGKPKPWPSK
jgi:hypothetical protein